MELTLIPEQEKKQKKNLKTKHQSQIHYKHTTKETNALINYI